MATFKVPFLVRYPGATGALPRWFWKPSTKLKAEGYRVQRVPSDWHVHTTPEALEAAAIAAAQTINAQVTAEREERALAKARMRRPEDLREGDSPEAVRGSQRNTRTVSDLIKLYRAADEFRDLRATTRRGYEQCLDAIAAWGGDVPVAIIDAPRVQNFKKGKRATPAWANACVRTLRLLLTFAMRLGWIAHNPAAKPGLYAIAPSGLIWPREAVSAFIAQADALGWQSIGTAVMLDEWIGQREGDVLRMPRAIYRAGALTLRQSKGNAGVSLPVDMVKPLLDRLAAEFERTARRGARSEISREQGGSGSRIAQIVGTTIIIDERTGLPYTADDFRHRFAAVRAALAKHIASFELDHLMPGRDMDDPNLFVARTVDLKFMHLRHTAITRLAEAGADDKLISAVSGHSLTSIATILSRYLVRTRASATRAFQLRLDAEAAAPAKKEKAE